MGEMMMRGGGEGGEGRERGGGSCARDGTARLWLCVCVHR